MKAMTASDLHRGQVIKLHYPQTHRYYNPDTGQVGQAPVGPFTTDAVVWKVETDRFWAVHETKATGCHKYILEYYYFTGCQITSSAVLEVKAWATNWVEIVGEMDVVEVAKMLADDCLGGERALAAEMKPITG